MISFHSLPFQLREELFPDFKGSRNTEEYQKLMESYEERWDDFGKAVELISNAVNSSRNRENSIMFNMHMTHQHRTLQQSSLKLIMRYIEFVASDKYETDGRNEQSKEVCQRLLKGFDWNGLTPSQCLPLI